MAEPLSSRDEGLGNLEAFIALLGATRQSLAENQALLDTRDDVLAEQAISSSDRLQAFQETVGGLTDSFNTGVQTAVVELGRLAHGASELAEQLSAEAIDGHEERFLAAVESAQASMLAAASHLQAALGEIERDVDVADEETAGLVADEEVGFGDLTATVAEADSTFTQTDFDLHGAFETTVAYMLEGLEQYMATVFNSFFDHLENEVQAQARDLFETLAQSSNRVLEDFDAAVESAANDLVGGTEPAMADSVDQLKDVDREQEWERTHALDEMKTLLEEVERNRAAMRTGSDTCAAYPPIVPQLAMARHVAERIQEMTDVFNPFG